MAVAEKIDYSEEFNAKVIEVYQSGMYSTAAACAKAYQINPKTNAELSQLQKELNRLKQENQILKNYRKYAFSL